MVSIFVSHLQTISFILHWKDLLALSHLPQHSVFFSSLALLFSPFPVALMHCRGWQGLIAQGCHSSILIIDPKTAQTIQVLERHKANVVKVSFLVWVFFICVIVQLYSRLQLTTAFIFDHHFGYFLILNYQLFSVKNILKMSITISWSLE